MYEQSQDKLEQKNKKIAELEERLAAAEADREAAEDKVRDTLEAMQYFREGF